MESTIIPIDRATCQASFDWHFIRELSVLEKTKPRTVTRARLVLSHDPYMERKLGHYSSGLLMEIAKQSAKSTFQTGWPSKGPVRYMVRELQMSFPAYTLLDETCPVDVECELDIIDTKNDAPSTGVAVVRFRQGAHVTAELRFTTTVMSPELEGALEQRCRTAARRGMERIGDER